MNNKLVGALLFATGAAIGSVVTWKLVKTKYEQIAQEEIESVREFYSNKHSDSNDEVVNGEVDEESLKYDNPLEQQLDLFEYKSMIQNERYASDEENQKEGGGEPVILAPYVISPDMFGEEGYEISMLTYYSDGVLEDDYWTVVENPDDLVGDDFMNHFDEYTDNTVFIRNEEKKTDYEITRDLRTYAESQEESPYSVNRND